MEFNVQRGAAQPAAPARTASNGGSAPGHTNGGSKKNVSWKSSPAWLRAVWIILLFSATGLVVALAALFYFGGTKETDYVDSSKQQAVFLTNGQVYFGKIKEINRQYVDLRGIYYLNVNQQVQPDQKDANSKTTTTAAAQQSQISLVKLGCELHGPNDQMLINRDQVTFWENLKTDGQVAKAVDKWVSENPNGQKCS
ncbi:MAG TPA: hypothetical protein VLF43_00570 [Candidatus Saccharimonadales bacterium]|nr:hypothetical protein [Candidatus Saccharimonadales bacterium]